MFDFFKKKNTENTDTGTAKAGNAAKVLTTEQKLLNALDNEYGLQIAKDLLRFKQTPDGFRLAGTKEENEAADWIAEQMRAIGLKNVQKEAFPVDTWDYRGASIRILDEEDPERAKLLGVGGFSGVPGTDEAGVTGQLVYIGDGTTAGYNGVDVTDKIVLIDTNSYHSWPYVPIFTQAEERGAKAIITVPVGGPGTYRDDLISIQDVLGTVAIPCVMSNKGGGDMLRERLKAGEELTVNIRVQAPVLPGQAHYVHGEIPGKNPDRYLLVTGHYDAYWDGFQDNATSLGSMMTIAKALIDIGYQPESTILFEINGAEEYGLTDRYFDFACGANAIVRQHPEWIEGGIAFNNFELSAHCETDGYMVATSLGYANTIGDFLEGLDFVTDTMAVANPSVQADDVVISKAGLPTYINVYLFEANGPDSFEYYDHTKWDNVDRFQPEVFEKNNKVFGLLNLMMDELPVMPLDLAEISSWCRDEGSFGHLEQLYPDWENWKRTLETFEAKASQMTQTANELNEEYRQKKAAASEEELRQIYARGWDYTKAIKAVNILLEREFVKYDAFMRLIPGHSQPALFTSALQELIRKLECVQSAEADEPGQALEDLLGLGNNYLIPHFDKKAYEMTALYAFTEDQTRGTWGENATLPFPDLYDVLTSVLAKKEAGTKAFAEEIEKLQNVREEQYRIFTDVMKNEQALMRQCIGILTEVLPAGGSAGTYQEPAAAGANSAGKNYSINTKVRDLVADPEAVKVLEEIAPGISSHPDLEWVMGMKLKSVAPISGGLLTKDMLVKMDDALRKL